MPRPVRLDLRRPRRARVRVEQARWPARGRSIRPGARRTTPPAAGRSGPCRMTLPRSTMATASQVRSTSSSRCEDSTTVRPSATRERIMSRISSMPPGSRPFIGSSRISSCGSPRRQAATPSRWRMPMEYFDTLSLALCRMPTRSSAGSMRPFAAGSRAAARIWRFWRPVRCPWKRGSSTMAPTRASAAVAVAGDRVPEQRHGAGVGVGQAQQHPDQGRLAGTVGPEIAEGAAAGDQQLDAVDGDVVPEALRQPVGLDGPLRRLRRRRRVGPGRRRRCDRARRSRGRAHAGTVTYRVCTIYTEYAQSASDIASRAAPVLLLVLAPARLGTGVPGQPVRRGRPPRG